MIFSYERFGNTRKIIPNLITDQEILRFDLFALLRVIWHEGNSMNSGHYISTIKLNNTVYLQRYSNMWRWQIYVL